MLNENQIEMRIAKVFFAKEPEYIYDPDHKQRPSGGYVKTEKGWSLKKKEDDKKTPSDVKINIMNKYKLREDVKRKQSIVTSIFTENEKSLGKTLNNVKDIEDFYKKAEETQNKMVNTLNGGNEKKWFGDSARILNKLDDSLLEPGPVLLLAPPKGRKRAKQKVDVDYGGDWNKLTDGVRCSIALDTFADLPRAIDGLRKSGVKIASKPKNRFENRLKSGYGDILLNVDYGNGFISEIQVHIKSMLYAKELGGGHKLYEQERNLMAKCDNDIEKLDGKNKKNMRKIIGRQKQLYDNAYNNTRIASSEFKLTKYMLSDSDYSYYLYGDKDAVAFVYKNKLPQFWNGKKWITVNSFLKFADNAVEITKKEFASFAKEQGINFE